MRQIIHVLDTKPLVHTKIRQDVTAGKCVAGMISPPRHHASCNPKVISANAALANLLHRAHMPWILEHPHDSWLWDVPKISALAARPSGFFCIFGFPYRKRTLFLVGTVDNRDLHCTARKCAGRGGRCSVTGENMFTHRLPHHAQSLPHHVTTPALLLLTMNARRFQRTHPFRGIGEHSISASRDFWMASLTLCT